jgi:hypothetical protein
MSLPDSSSDPDRVDLRATRRQFLLAREQTSVHSTSARLRSLRAMNAWSPDRSGRAGAESPPG